MSGSLLRDGSPVLVGGVRISAQDGTMRGAEDTQSRLADGTRIERDSSSNARSGWIEALSTCGRSSEE